MKKIREVLSQVAIKSHKKGMAGVEIGLSKSEFDFFEAELKKIFLEWVGSDEKIPPTTYEGKQWVAEANIIVGYNQRGQEIRDKVMG